MKRLFFALCLILGASSCGYDGGYRYPCQDPANWGDEECVPPVCEVDGTCTKDLVGFDPSEPTETTIQEVTTP